MAIQQKLVDIPLDQINLTEEAPRQWPPAPFCWWQNSRRPAQVAAMVSAGGAGASRMGGRAALAAGPNSQNRSKPAGDLRQTLSPRPGGQQR